MFLVKSFIPHRCVFTGLILAALVYRFNDRTIDSKPNNYSVKPGKFVNIIPFYRGQDPRMPGKQYPPGPETIPENTGMSSYGCRNNKKGFRIQTIAWNSMIIALVEKENYIYQ